MQRDCFRIEAQLPLRTELHDRVDGSGRGDGSLGRKPVGLLCIAFELPGPKRGAAGQVLEVYLDLQPFPDLGDSAAQHAVGFGSPGEEAIPLVAASLNPGLVEDIQDVAVERERERLRRTAAGRTERINADYFLRSGRGFAWN